MSKWFSLIKYFLIKDIRSRYAGSGFGIFWALIMPVVQIGLYWFVFSTVMGVRPYADGRISYVYFLLSTFFFWLAISEGITRSGSAIIENSELVKKVPFPNAILPIAVTISVYLQHFVGVLIFISLFTAAGMSHAGMLFILPVLILQLFFSIGAGLLMSAVVTYVRDLQQIMGFVLQGMFFLSPVLYSLDAVPERFRHLAYANPVTVFIESYHRIILDRALPGAAQIIWMVFLSLATLACGALVFRSLKEGFADIL